jgi:hypothetical protein
MQRTCTRRRLPDHPADLEKVAEQEGDPDDISIYNTGLLDVEQEFTPDPAPHGDNIEQPMETVPDLWIPAGSVLIK